MRRAAIAWMVVVGMLVPAAAIAQEAIDVRIQRISVQDHPVVRMLVTAVTGATLSVDDLTVVEADERLAPTSVTPLDGGSIETVLVMDTSGSMVGEPLEAAKGAAIEFLDELPASSTVAVVAFGNTASVVAEPTTDRARTEEVILELEASGETALFDGVVLGASLLGREDASSSLVVLTDGADTVSERTSAEAVSAVDAAEAAFFGVQLDTDEAETDSLEALAEATNGIAASAQDPVALGAIYGAIGSAVASQYIVEYQSLASGPTTVAVEVSGLGTSPAFPVRMPTVVAPPTENSADGTTSTVLVSDTIAPEPVVAPLFGSSVWLYVGLGAAFLGFLGLLGFLFVGGSGTGGVRPTFRTRGTQAVSGLSRSLVEGAERAGSGSVRGLDASLERACLRLRAGEFIVAIGGLAIVGFVLGFAPGQSVLVGLLVALGVAVVGLLLPGILADRRQSRFEDQLPDALAMLASTIRTGYAPIQATELVGRESEAPMAEELLRAVGETRLGRDYTDALRAVAERMDSDDFRWVVDAMEINRSVGGDISEILDKVAETIRSRIRLRREVAALSAEGRLSAFVLVAVPFGLAGFLYVRDPEYLAPLVESVTGIVMTVLAVLGMIIGIFVIRRMISLEE